MTDRYDLVVVGAGTAGCVVAARASEDPSRRVLLVEAGPDPQPVPALIADPKRQAELVRGSDYVRRYDVARADGSTFELLSGRIVGGGSAVNNCVAVRPLPADFADWARFAGDAWSYDAMLPLMRAIETDPDFGDGPLHGSDGPLVLERAWKLDDPADPPVAALLEAVAAVGLPRCPDLNVPEPLGVCASPYNVRDGIRQSTAVAWLDPARSRPNLDVAADTTAGRLVLAGRRVTGVELLTAAGPRSVEADTVVLAAGTYHSPQLLELSGIGRPAELARLGIPVAHELPGIGENLQDHGVVTVGYEGTPALRPEHVIPKVRLIVRSRDDLALPDLHVFFRPSVSRGGGTKLLPVSLHLLDHRSRGRVTLRSAEPDALPRVDPALVEHPDDVRALVDGMRLVERLTGHPALAAYYGPRVAPASGADLADHVRITYDSYHHGVGTCRMGPAGDPDAVVDGSLRVHGLGGLLVADASVLPTIPHANTNLAAILVGEMAARSIAASR